MGAIENCTQRWDANEDGEICVLTFSNDNKIIGGEIKFSSYSINRLNIEVISNQFTRESTQVDAREVPNLMEALTRGEINFQLTALTELGNKFEIINEQVDEIIKNGEVEGRIAIVDRDSNNLQVINAKLSKNWDLKILIDEITYDYINLQPLQVELYSGSGSPIRFTRLISPGKIKELPFLNTLVKIPNESLLFTPDIEEFMENVSNIDCPKFSQLAKTISLSYKLDDELEHKNFKKPKFKL
jgi:hypothetical protein